MRNHLVVVLPGIGGSRLVDPQNPDHVVWDARLGEDIGHLLFHPEDLSLDRWPELRPAGLIRSKKLFGATPIDGYEKLLSSLAKLPFAVLDDGTSLEPIMKANVVALGYDFRLGIAHATQTLEDQIRRRLAFLWPKGDWEGRLIFVAHSMGGLVARYWLAQDGNAALCRELITLGTPHRGAPLALDWLANGIPVLGRHVFNGGVRDLLRSWQGMYDLLPTGKDVFVGGDHADSTAWVEAYEIAAHWNADYTAGAKGLHAEIATVWNRMPADERPSVQPRVGYGHGTLRQAHWDGRRRVTVSKDSSGKPGRGAWEGDLGDGTVPAINALPREMPDAPLGMRVAYKHGLIMNLPEVTERLESAEARPAPRYIEAPDSVPAVLGVDHDELGWAHTPTPVTATPIGIPIENNTGACSVTVSSKATRLDWDSDLKCFVGEIPPSKSGAYHVRFDWEGSDALSTASILELLEPNHRAIGDS